MSYVKDCEFVRDQEQGRRSNSSQGLATVVTSSAVKIPLPPRLWITDAENDSSDCSDVSKDDAFVAVERARVRSRFRHYKQRCVVNVPIGIFWDIENCQVPRGCSALDVVSAIRNKFLTGRREADFVVVCDVRKEAATRLQELNDAQVNLIHVCGTQKNAADEKLRQCMRRFGELHGAPAALLLISGDINFAADLSDFRHRKNIEVILVHKQNTSPALIACATSHYSFNDLTDDLPRHPKSLSQTDEEEPTCEMEVTNLPLDQPAERVSKRLRRLADNCGGKVLRVTAPTAVLKFPTPDHAARALKRMEGEDVFGRKIGTRYLRSGPPPTYSSDEGYSTGTTQPPVQPPRPESLPPRPDSLPLRPESLPPNVHTQVSATVVGGAVSVSQESRWWWRALQQLPADPSAPPAPPALLPPPAAPPRPRKIRGTHGSSNLNRSGGSSSNSEDRGREASASRAVSPWNCSGSASEHSDAEEGPAELTIANLPPFEPVVLQQMLGSLLSQYVGVVRVSVWGAAEGPVASVVVRSEWDARLAIARVHKRRLDSQWNGRRLELAVGRPSPAPNLDTLRARLRAILLEQPNHCLPLLRLRDAYASRHCCALTTSDLAKVKDTVIIHEGLGRIVQLVDLSPVVGRELEAAPWKCGTHARAHSGCEDAAAVLQPVVIEIAVLTKHVHMLLESHGGIIPLLSFVDCYECSFPPLCVDSVRGVPLELLLRAVGGAEVRDAPARHLAWKPHSVSPSHSRISDSSMCSSERERERERPRTAPALEPMLALFERELVDLLRSAPRCCIPFSKLIPAFHHHFGRQCRVADYGFTKLPDLLAALSNTIVVLGSGSSRVITLSAAAQGRRWSSDLVKLLKTLPGRAVHPQDIPQLYQATFGRPFTPVNYGVCTVAELMERVTPHLVTVGPDGSLSLPRPTPTAEEKARTVHFAMQTVELLCYTPNFRMEFSRFVPAYHAHFGRQLRVAHYGCVKLVELFELISDTVTVCCEPTGEKSVSLATHTARSVMGERLRTLGVIPLEALSGAYAAMWGGPPCAEALGARSLEHAVFACGGSVEHGLVRPPGDSPKFANDALATCAVLAADKSVARGSTIEYLTSALRRSGIEVELEQLEAAGVVEVCARRVRMSGEWRAAWRIARVLAATPPAAPHHVLDMYIERYGQDCYTQQGIGGMLEVLCEHPSVFCESGGLWELRGGVAPPPPPPPAAHPHKQEDYSLHDTPPGQKGSRVFESPKVNIWCSPPASALPVPTALLTNDNKRRTRLAAQFDAV